MSGSLACVMEQQQAMLNGRTVADPDSGAGGNASNLRQPSGSANYSTAAYTAAVEQLEAQMGQFGFGFNGEEAQSPGARANGGQRVAVGGPEVGGLGGFPIPRQASDNGRSSGLGGVASSASAQSGPYVPGGTYASGSGSSGRSSPTQLDVLAGALMAANRTNSVNGPPPRGSSQCQSSAVGGREAASVGLARQLSPPLMQQRPMIPPNGMPAGLGSSNGNASLNSMRRLYHFAANPDDNALASGAGGNGTARCFNNVEEMVEIIRRLPRHAPASEHVASSLYFLDNQAFAGMLKLLGKAGLAYRAFELFDYVTRRVDEGCDELAGLSDTYTYTTIISLSYGSRENCRRGLQYFAQMRRRNVCSNTFTYTALMSICMKVNEAETTLDIYADMLSAGLKPSAITYKIALDAYCRTERWDEAYGVFVEVEAKGHQVEPRTYCLVFMALGRTRACPAPDECPEIALRLYQRLCAETGTTAHSVALLTNLIQVFGRVGLWQHALHFFQAIPQAQHNDLTYRSMVAAFSKAGMAAEAHQVEQMRLSFPQPRNSDTRGICSSWNGRECFFMNLHGSCKYMHSHRPGISNKPS